MNTLKDIKGIMYDIALEVMVDNNFHNCFFRENGDEIMSDLASLPCWLSAPRKNGNLIVENFSYKGIQGNQSFITVENNQEHVETLPILEFTYKLKEPP